MIDGSHPGNAKLADFGTVKQREVEEDRTHMTTVHRIGTPYFMAAEYHQVSQRLATSYPP
jgi:serine/threonine protein kinase